jgi:D-3-phosphoglycerate dehydrogenase
VNAASPGSDRRVLITTVPFGEASRAPLEMLERRGISFSINPTGRRLREEELAGMIGQTEVLIAGTEPITGVVMDNAPNLRLIARVGIGLDSVDLTAARARGIAVTYTPDAPAPAVAELTVGLMLSLLREIPQADRLMHNGRWRRLIGGRIATSTVGVMGVGRVGRRVIRILRGGFPSVRILGNDLEPDPSLSAELSVEWTDKQRLYRESDVITVHLPLTPGTHGLIGAAELAMMKPSTVLINTSRGEIVDESDLVQALLEETIHGAAVDVFEHEPYVGPLAGIERCVLTCHMGSMSRDCRIEMERGAVEEALRFFSGEGPQQPVPEFEYELARSGRVAGLGSGRD